MTYFETSRWQRDFEHKQTELEGWPMSKLSACSIFVSKLFCTKRVHMSSHRCLCLLLIPTSRICSSLFQKYIWPPWKPRLTLVKRVNGRDQQKLIWCSKIGLMIILPIFILPILCYLSCHSLTSLRSLCSLLLFFKSLKTTNKIQHSDQQVAVFLCIGANPFDWRWLWQCLINAKYSFIQNHLYHGEWTLNTWFSIQQSQW